MENKTYEQKQVDVDLSILSSVAQGPNSEIEPMEVAQVTEDLGPIMNVADIPTEEEDELLNSQPKESVIVEEPGVKTPVSEKVRLSGAARKRLKMYLDDGIDIKVARKLCTKPMREARKEISELKLNRKRVRSDGSTPPDAKQQPKRAADIDVDGTPRKVSSGSITKPTATLPSLQQQQQKAPSYKEVTATTKIGVIPPDFPNSRWSNEQLEAIQSAVLDKIYDLRKGTMKPSFSSCTFKPGWLTFACSDDETVQWLKTHMPTLKPWSDAVLKVVAEDEVPKAQIFVGYFPEKADKSTEKIIGLMEGQNRDLSIEYWKVLKRVVKGGVVELTLSIDPVSADMLKSKGHKVNYGYGSVLIRPTRPQNEVVRGLPNKAKAATSTLVATSSKGVSSNPTKLDEQPSCSKDTAKPSSFRPPLKKKADKKSPNKSESGRRRKWERNSAEESALLNTNRGKKMAKRASKSSR